MNILEERRKKMGIPASVGQVQTQQVATPNKFKALDDLKRGAKRGEFRQFIKAERSSQQDGFQIPETKKQRNPNEAKSKNAVAPSGPVMKSSSEANNLESIMFDDNVRMSSSSAQGEISEISGPTFDPQSVLAKKELEATKNSEGYTQYSQASQVPKVQAPQSESADMQKIMDMMQVMMEQKTVSSDMTQMKTMMETIAKRVAENTMRSVINEFVDKTKKQNLYEVYDKKQNVVKIKGQLYKLSPVKVKS